MVHTAATLPGMSAPTPPPAFDPLTAYHEAGHAVMALLLGRQVHKVSVRPNASRLGQCEFRKGVQRPSDDFIETEILIALAGAAAEAHHAGEPDWAGAGRDLRAVRQLAILRAGERGAERLEKRLFQKATYLLADDQAWAAVERIAAELLKTGEISGRAARHFFEEATRE